EPTEGGHDALARLAVDPMAFHHLEIFEATRSLGAEIHAGLCLPARESHVLQRCQAFTAILLALRNRPIPSFATAECGFQPCFDAPTVKVPSEIAGQDERTILLCIVPGEAKERVLGLEVADLHGTPDLGMEA